jgi:hypothetical protein
MADKNKMSPSDLPGIGSEDAGMMDLQSSLTSSVREIQSLMESVGSLTRSFGGLSGVVEEFQGMMRSLSASGAKMSGTGGGGGDVFQRGALINKGSEA